MKAKAPIAKHEIFAEARSKDNPNFIDVYFSSEQAKEWLNKQIPAYRGKNDHDLYGLRENEPVPNSSWFVVNKCFDVKEVIEYFNSWSPSDQ